MSAPTPADLELAEALREVIPLLQRVIDLLDP